MLTLDSSLFLSLSTSDLARVSGGDGTPAPPASSSWLGKAARFGGKLVPAAKVVVAGVDGVNGYDAARAKGHGVARSVGEGTLDAANGATFGLVNWITGR